MSKATYSVRIRWNWLTLKLLVTNENGDCTQGTICDTLTIVWSIRPLNSMLLSSYVVLAVFFFRNVVAQ